MVIHRDTNPPYSNQNGYLMVMKGDFMAIKMDLISEMGINGEWNIYL